MKGKAGVRVLKALLAFMNSIGNWECKTIGNGHPEGLHCFACTFWDIRSRIKRAVDFWDEDEGMGDRADRALS